MIFFIILLVIIISILLLLLILVKHIYCLLSHSLKWRELSVILSIDIALDIKSLSTLNISNLRDWGLNFGGSASEFLSTFIILRF